MDQTPIYARVQKKKGPNLALIGIPLAVVAVAGIVWATSKPKSDLYAETSPAAAPAPLDRGPSMSNTPAATPPVVRAPSGVAPATPTRVASAAPARRTSSAPARRASPAAADATSAASDASAIVAPAPATVAVTPTPAPAPVAEAPVEAAPSPMPAEPAPAAAPSAPPAEAPVQ